MTRFHLDGDGCTGGGDGETYDRIPDNWADVGGKGRMSRNGGAAVAGAGRGGGAGAEVGGVGATFGASPPPFDARTNGHPTPTTTGFFAGVCCCESTLGAVGGGLCVGGLYIGFADGRMFKGFEDGPDGM